MLLDDFSGTDGLSLIGTRWEGYTDRVMGGRSDMAVGTVQTEDGAALHMTGRVTTENNGGFIQVRLSLSENGTFDASAYHGVAVTVRGNEGGSGNTADSRGVHGVGNAAYYVHLRTSRTRTPWSHYAQQLPVTTEWQRIELPFEGFHGQLMLGGRRADTRRLRSIAIVAAYADFQADIQVRDVAFY